MKKFLSVFIVLLSINFAAIAQFGGGGGDCSVNFSPSVSNETVCSPNTSVTLYANLSGTGGNTARWYTSVTGGTPIHTGTSYTVSVSTTTTFYVDAYSTYDQCTFGLRMPATVTVQSPQGGSIYYDESQTICYNTVPNTISNQTSADSGSQYQWQKRSAFGSWTTMSGQTSASLSPGYLTEDTFFRRKATTTGSCGGYVRYSNSVEVKVYPNLTAGSIGGAATICYNQDAPSVTNSTSASGGNGSYSYQWQHKSASGSWSNISGATSTSYNPPRLTSTRDYRRRVISCGQTQYSNSVRITVKSSLSPGSISNAQTVCYGGNPSTIGNSSSPSNGMGGYSYQWQHKSASGNWSNISGATSSTYNPPSLTSTRDYRRRVISCGQTKYTSSVRVTVKPPLSAGSINNAQTVCYGGNPSTIGNSTSPSNGLGGYSYQWQHKSTSGNWSNISGATSSTYNPPSLTSTRDYRRRVISCGQTKYSNSVRVTVKSALSPGSISNAQTVCYGGNPSTIGNSTSPSNGLGGYSYQWQHKSTSGSWSNISGATSSSYNPPSLTSTRDYRRRVISCGQTKYSNSVRVTVKSALSPGSISNAQTVCYGGNPSTIGNSTSPSNGLGGYSYQWQHKSTSGSWANISGATSSSYNPPSLTSTRDYRRRVISCSQTKFSNTVRVTVRSELSPGSISGAKTICYNSSAGTLANSSSPSHGNGTYSFQWQVSTDGGSTYANIAGATSDSYNPGSLTQDRHYRRKVTSCNDSKYTNTVFIIVRSALSGGSISGSKSICLNQSAGLLSDSTSPANGDGNYNYQWQFSTDGGATFSNISGTNSASYSPGSNLTTTTEFRRKASSCGQTAYSNAVVITVNDLPNVEAGNTLSPYQFETAVNLNSSGESPTNGTFSGAYVSNNNFNAAQSGIGNHTVTYHYTNSNGCTSSDTKTISVQENPVIAVSGSEDIVWGENRELTVASGFASYQWYKDGSTISNATSNVYTVQSVGEYYVRVTSATGASLNLSPVSFINLASQQNENFVQTIQYKVPRKVGESVSEIGEVIEEISYLDGLGRKTQTVRTQASPSKNDLVSPIEYDELGRVSKQFLPYVPNKKDGFIDEEALRASSNNYTESSQYNFYSSGNAGYVSSTTVPYTETVYEKSPLNRPVAQYAAGEEWAKGNGAKPVTTDYQINSVNDEVIRFFVNGNSLQIDNEYGNGVFQKTVVTDENGNQSATFTDHFDRTILKRNIANGEKFDTYYVYDLYDNLRFVIPPEAIHQLTSNAGQFPTNLLDNFVFQYRYDDRNRMEWKKVPGAEPIIMIYDDRDRLVLTQDGEQARSNLFSFTKYDALNRPIMTGEKQINISIPNLRDTLSGGDWLQNYTAFETLSGSKFGYTSNSLPKTLALNEIYTVTYYDNYDFRSEISLDGSEFDFINNGMNNAFQQTDSVKGQVTGSLTRVLNTSEMMASVNYYDERYRLLQNISQQKDDKLIRSNNSYDFVGNLLEANTIYRLSNEKIKVSENFNYDHADRMLTANHELSTSINWQNVIGYSVDENFDLTHDGNAGYHNTSAHTEKAISIDQEGFIEHRPEMFSRMLFGLNDSPSGAGHSNMEYCLYVAANGRLTVYENGSNKGGLGNYQIGDVLQVAKTKDEILYIKNGKVLRKRQLQHKNVAFYGDVTSYNVGDRISDVFFSTSGKQLMVSNQYNELGELINKKLHDDGDNFAQSVDYRYNIRGWLTRINHANLSADNASEKTDLFGMELGYTDNFGLTAEAQYNGNIAAVKWGGKRNDINVDKVVQQNAYGYAYDGVNRITEANFYESASQNPGQKYQLRINEYDQNGNIKQLQRRDATGGLMDDLTYDYSSSGNQLNYVSDAVTDSSGFIDGNTSGNDYTYDDNGNMISDANKGIDSIKYNNLNLPEEVSFANGNKIVYFYDASGAKLRQEVYENNVLQKATDYIGSLILEDDTLQFIQTAEGRVVPKTVDGVDKNEYQYHLKDHLGNVRTTFAVRDDEYATDFETSENPYFDNYDQITRLSSLLNRSGNYAHRTAGGGSEVVGLMKSLYVSKGDIVSAEVYGKYLDAQFSDEAINGVALVDALVTMLGGGAISGEGTVVQNNLNSDYISAAMADGSQETSPKAYLNYILFDENFTYLNSGFERLAASAADPGDGSGTHQKLSFEEIQIEEDGYLMVFLSNESQQAVEVFWDDFRVDHHYNAVLQADDYYPFGLTFNSYQRSYSKANDYKYNGFEEQVEWGVYDYQARYYDAALGRFLNVDPAADLMRRHSPYNYAFDNPIRFIDPDGMMPSDVVGDEDCCPDLKDVGEGIVAYGQYMKRDFKKGLDAIASFVGPDSNFEGDGEEVDGGIPLVTAVDMPSESTKTTAEKTEATLNIDLLLASSGGGAGKFSGSDDPSVDIANSLSKVAGLFGSDGGQSNTDGNSNKKNYVGVDHQPNNENEVQLDTLAGEKKFRYGAAGGTEIHRNIVRTFFDGKKDTLLNKEIIPRN